MPQTFLRLPEVQRRVGYKHATIYKKMQLGEFPLAVRIGANAVGWVEAEIDAWVQARIEARDTMATSREAA